MLLFGWHKFWQTTENHYNPRKIHSIPAINHSNKPMTNNPANRDGPVFLSYARSDFAVCEQIKTALEKAGIACWRDTDDIEPGEKWLEGLAEALKQARAMIVLWSEASEHSDYMEREFHQAEELKLRIIPVILQGAGIPFRFKDRNAINLNDDWNTGIARLIRCFSGAPTQRQAELDWLQTLQQQLKTKYTPLAGESRQSPKKQLTIAQTMVQQGVLEHLARRVAQHLPEQKTEFEDIQTAFSQVSRAVLLGEPGAGKTTTLRKLAGDSLAVALQNPEAPIPLLVSLGRWTEADQSFDAFLEEQLDSLRPYLNNVLQPGRCLLLLDGLNETPTEFREQKSRQLNQWLQQDKHRQLVCYVSCRDLDYTAAPLKLDLDTIRIRPLDPLRIHAFIREYCSNQEEGNQDDADTLFWALSGGEPLHQTWLAWQRAGATEQQFWFGDDVRFSHQLLQEYFTALMMQEKLDNKQLQVQDLWRDAKFWQPSGWEEAIVLLAGLYASDCSKVLRGLLPVNPELLVRCIKEADAPYDRSVLEDLQQHWRDAWMDLRQWPQPEARASIARAFGALNLDIRKGVGLTDQGLPNIDWVRIPGGEINLENNAGTFPVESFYLARYPVTNAQFQSFIDDPEGYANPRWWAELDAKPETPELSRWTEDNHPRETVSWFEAMAFCAWLLERLGYANQLPAEWQWQQAACSGKTEFNYPWGRIINPALPILMKLCTMPVRIIYNGLRRSAFLRKAIPCKALPT